MTQITYDVAFERIQDLAKEMAEAKDRNEATTRLQLIDRLVFDCLGWDRDDAELEGHQDGMFADYLLSKQNPRLVVEAKREGETFQLPEELDSLCSLDALRSLGTVVTEALDQVERYAQKWGTPYAAISNGHQVIAFIGSRQDGVSPRDGKALVFPSPAALVERFQELWDNLCPSGCVSMHLTRLLGKKSQARPPKLAESIHDYPGTKPVDERQHMLATLNVLFLPDYVRDDEDEDKFLLECYCPPGAYSQMAMLNRSVLSTRYSVALGKELDVALDEAMNKGGVNPALRDEVGISSAGKEPLVLLGDVGVGKTMFLRRLLRVDVKDIAADGVVLYTNLGNDAVLTDIKTYVATSFKDQLRERYGVNVDDADFLRGTYQAEVKRFARSIHGALAESDPLEYQRREIDHLAALTANVEEHLRRSLEHLVKLRRQQVVVVLDNIDQRLREDQEEVFLIAQSIAKSWPCSVFVTLRPETFNASRLDGTLSGYQPRAFTVQPPRVEMVVGKRLEFGAKEYEEEGKLPDWLGWTADSADLRDYLQVLVKSFRRSEPLQRTLVNLSGGNVRRALELMTSFINSPWGDHYRTLERARGRSEEDKDYLVPFHVFLKAAMLGDAAFYSPGNSAIPNLFDISSRDPREHFLLPCILGLLVREADNGKTEGYVPVGDVYSSLQTSGFGPDQVGFALSRGHAGRCLEVLPPEATVDGAKSLRVTSVGVFAHHTLSREYQYLDAVIVDTPITDGSRRNKIGVVRSLEPSLKRAETFLDYLDESWEESGLESVGLFDWPANARAIREELESISARLT